MRAPPLLCGARRRVKPVYRARHASWGAAPTNWGFGASCERRPAMRIGGVERLGRRGGSAHF